MLVILVALLFISGTVLVESLRTTDLDDENAVLTECVAASGMSVSGSQSSLRGAFPECILEDSGFQEPQEFRMRCSSMAGSLQRTTSEGAGMDPARRRHASAPNHVQPSDSDKNRTMLFQVGLLKLASKLEDSQNIIESNCL